MNASHTKYVDDLPADPPEFEFDLIAEALAGILAEPARRSVVLGLHGQWGSGKTTLMDALRTQLVSAVTDPITVDFNAWKYQERSALWRALILRVLGELKKCSTPEEGPAIEELEQSLYRTFAVRENGPWSVNWRTLIVEAASIGLSAIHLGVAGEIIRALGLGRRNRHPKESDYSKVVSGTDFEKLGGVLERRIIDRQVVQVESVEQFLGKFTELVDRLTASGRKVFVLIDDLDRCLPGAALEIFEAIKLFMDAPNCRFVVAVDREVIRRGLLVKFAGVSDNTRAPFITVDEYLEKTISISYDVPRLSGADVDILMDSVSLPFTLQAEHRKLVHSALGANPRRVKRFMNLLSVQAEVARLAVARKMVVPPSLCGDVKDDGLAVMLKLILISYRYPGIFQTALGDPDLLLRLQRIANNPKSGSGADLSDKAARRARLEAEEDSVILASSTEDDFWTLMKCSPDFTANAGEAKRLMSWFRSA